MFSQTVPRSHDCHCMEYYNSRRQLLPELSVGKVSYFASLHSWYQWICTLGEVLVKYVTIPSDVTWASWIQPYCLLLALQEGYLPVNICNHHACVFYAVLWFVTIWYCMRTLSRRCRQSEKHFYIRARQNKHGEYFTKITKGYVYQMQRGVKPAAWNIIHTI